MNKIFISFIQINLKLFIYLLLLMKYARFFFIENQIIGEQFYLTCVNNKSS